MQDNSYDEKELISLIKNFFQSFDTKDWGLMEQCLDENIELDYRSFRGTPIYSSTASDYIEKRKIAMDGLRTEHKSTNYLASKKEDAIICTCSFEIKRFELKTEDYYHSYGTYEFHLRQREKTLKIYKIKQEVTKNEGNKSIHGAFRKIKSN